MKIGFLMIPALGSALILGSWLLSPAPSAAPQKAATTKTVAEKKPTHTETATFAAGCFWSMEAIFKQLKGVYKVEPGYAGGTKPHPSYEEVETGTTGYAETANITYDPKVITYRDLLEVLLTVRDPTTLNQQGPDVGPQYRSVIFFRSKAQQQAAQEVIAKMTKAHQWQSPIVTEVTPYTNFYRAEDYHLNYYNLHPDEGYCANVIAPEIADFRAKFKSKLKN